MHEKRTSSDDARILIIIIKEKSLIAHEANLFYGGLGLVEIFSNFAISYFLEKDAKYS